MASDPQLDSDEPKGQELVCAICFESSSPQNPLSDDVYDDNNDNNSLQPNQDSITHWCHMKCGHTLCMECSVHHFILHSLKYCPTCREIPKYLVISPLKYIDETKFDQICSNNLKLDNDKFYFDSHESLEKFMRLFQLFCYICTQSKQQNITNITFFKNFMQLMDHMKDRHSMYYCDLCLENLKIFPAQRKAYKLHALEKHRLVGDPNFFEASTRIDKILGVHSSSTSLMRISRHFFCRICTTWFFDIDALYKHCRESHLFCHYCDIHSNMFYEDYRLLLDHFKKFHFVCIHNKCKDDQFANVFDTRSKFSDHLKSIHNINLKGDAGAKFKKIVLEELKENPEKHILFTLCPKKHQNKKDYSNKVPTHEQMLERAIMDRFEELIEKDVTNAHLSSQNISNNNSHQNCFSTQQQSNGVVEEFPELTGQSKNGSSGLLSNHLARRLQISHNIRVQSIKDDRRNRRKSTNIPNKNAQKQNFNTNRQSNDSTTQQTINISLSLPNKKSIDAMPKLSQSHDSRNNINSRESTNMQHYSINHDYAKASELMRTRHAKIKLNSHVNKNVQDDISNNSYQEIVSIPPNRLEIAANNRTRLIETLKKFKSLKNDKIKRNDWQKPPGFD